MSSAVQRLQKQLTQLREEAKVERIPVSEAIEVMKRYITEHSQGDALVIGVNQSDNPFRDQKSCAIL